MTTASAVAETLDCQTAGLDKSKSVAEIGRELKGSGVNYEQLYLDLLCHPRDISPTGRRAARLHALLEQKLGPAKVVQLQKNFQAIPPPMIGEGNHIGRSTIRITRRLSSASTRPPTQSATDEPACSYAAVECPAGGENVLLSVDRQATSIQYTMEFRSSAKIGWYRLTFSSLAGCDDTCDLSLHWDQDKLTHATKDAVPEPIAALMVLSSETPPEGRLRAFRWATSLNPGQYLAVAGFADAPGTELENRRAAKRRAQKLLQALEIDAKTVSGVTILSCIMPVQSDAQATPAERKAGAILADKMLFPQCEDWRRSPLYK